MDVKNKSVNITLNVHQLIGLRYSAFHKLNKHRKEALKAKRPNHKVTHDNAADAWVKTIKLLDNALKLNLTKEELDSLQLPGELV